MTAAHHLSLLTLAAGVLLGCAHTPTTTAQTPARTPEAVAFDAEQVRKGAELAAIGDCRTCHTRDGGEAFAGSRPLPTPFGTLYSTNITPDAETGIGRYTRDEFRRAMREGIDRSGRHLYPAFPYNHFTHVTDDDIDALYAFIMTRAPVSAHPPDNRLAFPANVRPLLAAWNWLYLDERRFEPDPRQSAAWNRGAYLVEGLGHCGACHTPRNLVGAEKKHERFAGGDAEGWHAPGLMGRSPAPLPWTRDALFRYLRTGFDSDHGLAAGPMAPVVEGLASVREADVHAIATYLASVPAPARPAPAGDVAAAAERREFDASGRHAPDRATEAGARAAYNDDAGGIIFAGTCASCHYAGNALPRVAPVALGLATSVNATSPRTLLNVVVDGVHPPTGAAGAIMPGFGDALTDTQIVAVVQYVRARFSDRPQWSDVAETLRAIEREKRP